MNRASIMISLIVLVVAARLVHATEVVHDVVPEDWISYNGHFASNQVESEKTYIFPSWSCATSELVSYTAENFLTKRNRIPKSAQYCLVCGLSCKSDGHPFIKVERNNLDLKFTVETVAVEYIRKLKWEEFCSTQASFEKWLLDLSIKGGLFKCARRRFGQNYEQQLRDFWLKCLKTAEFANGNLTPLMQPISQRPVTAQQMGSILLVPSIRLKINWGGTVFYPEKPTETITRQTVTSSSDIDIVERNGVPSLFASTNYKQRDNAVGDSILNPKVTVQTPIGTSNHIIAGQWYDTKIIPVFNLQDLQNVRAFEPVAQNRIKNEDIKHLILFVPNRYPKADRLGISSDDNIRSWTFPTTSNKGDNGIEEALLQCFIIVCTSKPFGDNKIWPRPLMSSSAASPQSKSSDVSDIDMKRVVGQLDGSFKGTFEGTFQGSLENRNNFKLEGEMLESDSRVRINGRFEGEGTGVFKGVFNGTMNGKFVETGNQSGPEYRAMVFGNQTQISVQVPVNINGVRQDFADLGTTVWDILQSRSPWILGKKTANSSSKPIFELTRILPDENGLPSDRSNRYRFYSLPKESLNKIEIGAMDSLGIRP